MPLTRSGGPPFQRSAPRLLRVVAGVPVPTLLQYKAPPLLPVALHRYSSCSFQLPLQTMPPMPLASCHLPRLLGPLGLSLYAGLNTAHLVLYLDAVHVGFARPSGARLAQSRSYL